MTLHDERNELAEGEGNTNYGGWRKGEPMLPAAAATATATTKGHVIAVALATPPYW